jgi:hypothetical protein
MGTTGEGVLLRPMRKASARIHGLKRGGSRFSKLGGLENRCNSTSWRDVPGPRAAGRRDLRATYGEGGPGFFRSAIRERTTQQHLGKVR